MKYNLLFKIIASLVGACYAVFGMYLFFFVDPYAFKSITEVILGIIFIVIGLNIFFEFSIKVRYIIKTTIRSHYNNWLGCGF